MNDQSASGVIFSRNPDTGEDKIKGEYLLESQGEDVVSGFITPKNIFREKNDDAFVVIFPDLFSNKSNFKKFGEGILGLFRILNLLLSPNILWVLQSRDAELNAKASFKGFKRFC